MTKRINAEPPTERRRDEAGVALVVVALAMVVLLGSLGLAIDMSYLRTVKQRMQTAADAAALAGASELSYGDVTSAAKADAATNGFTDGANGVTVSVNNPPQTAGDPHYNDSQYVETIISQSVPTMFGKIFGTKTVTVQARSEAHLGSSPNCFFVSSPSATFQVNGGSLTAQCGIVVSSSASVAFQSNGATISATSISVHGGAQINGGSVNPSPQTNVATPSDPLSYIPKPTVGPCGSGSGTTWSGSKTQVQLSNTTATFNPGVYCGGIQFNGGVTASFAPGVYILTNSGSTSGYLQLNGTSTLTGSGVTFYMTGSGSFQFNGTSHFNLTAPTTGTYAGILFFQNPNDSSTAQLNGDSSTVFQGALYFPGALLQLNGGTGNAAYTIIDASQVQLNGTNIVNADYSSLPGGSPVRSNTAVLDE
ncbi:MAG TPA: pilus assembly protein TadG-related protein [Terriglobia bacterium]|nr:pilus assembly protein TadG-related protein [Terriglobia bacterium]